MLQNVYTIISFAEKICTGWQLFSKLKQLFNLSGERVEIIRQEQMNGQNIYSIDEHDKRKSKNLHSLQLTAAQIACLCSAGYLLATGSEDPFTTAISTTAVATTAYDLCTKGKQAFDAKDIKVDDGALLQKPKP